MYHTVVIANSVENTAFAGALSQHLAVAVVHLDTTLLTVSITSNLYGMVLTNAHFHQALPGANGSSVILIYNSTTGTASGVFPVTSAQVDLFLAGSMYVNYHTSKFPSGELRGQVLFADSGIAVLVGDQEGPSYCGTSAPGFSASAGWGTVQLGTDSVRLTLRTSDFTSSVTQAHIHGPATANTTAGSKCDIASSAAPWVSSGYTSFTCVNKPNGVWSESELNQFRDGLYYFNVHTSTCSGGEIRGQIFFPSRFDPASIYRTALSASVSPYTSVSVTSPAKGSAVLVRVTPSSTSSSTTLYASFLSSIDLTADMSNAHLHCKTSINAECSSNGVSNWGPSQNYQVPMKMTRHAYFPLALTAAQEANVKNGVTYYNVHTTAYTGGEISGVLTKIDTPIVPTPLPTPKPPVSSASTVVASISALLLVIVAIFVQG